MARQATYEFLGERDYVHGSSMLLSMLQEIAGLAGRGVFDPATIKVFKVNKEFATHGVVEALPAEAARSRPDLARAAARLDLATGQGRFTGLVFDRPARPVTRRRADYDAGDYVSWVEPEKDGCGRAGLTAINDPIDLLRGVVEANRQLSWRQAEAPERIRKMRWSYVSAFGIVSGEKLASAPEVEFTPRAVVARHNNLFVVKRFRIPGLGGDWQAEICFSHQLG